MARKEGSMGDRLSEQRRDFDDRASDMMDHREGKRGDRSGMGMKGFDIQDNTQAWEVRKINTNSEQYDTKKIRPYEDGSKGYPPEAWNYRY